MKRHYFDYAAATPVDPRVEKAMRPYWSKIIGNPGSLHWFGQQSSAAIFEARRKIASILGCHYQEIIFTGSATEANNLALRGITANFKNPEIIISAIEHESIAATCRDLEKSGAKIIYIPASKDGIIDLKKIKSALTENTILVSVIYAQNEIGVVQPIAKIAEIIKNFRGNKTYPLFHTDAAQAFNYLNCKVEDLSVDLMTLSSQKIYGPKGVGLLYIRDLKAQSSKALPAGRQVKAMVTGGGQESGFRSGSENVPGIIGFAKAMEIADRLRETESQRLWRLQNYFLEKIKKISNKIQLNGNLRARLPNNINLYFPGPDTAQDLIIKLDLNGAAVSSGAACAARTCQPSKILKALNLLDDIAMKSIRVTFGRPTNKKAVDQLLKIIQTIV